MPIWNRLRDELDRAGKAAQSAFDEGRLRLEVFRARQRADRTAQELGYALFRAREAGGDLSAEAYARHAAELRHCQTEAARLEAEADRLGLRRSPVSDPPPPRAPEAPRA